MTTTRMSMAEQLVPGLNVIFGDEYGRYMDEHKVLFDQSSSNRAFEEDLMEPGFENAYVKPEGASIVFTDTEEGWKARYTHETVALGFAITEEATEDNLYVDKAKQNTKRLARAMHNTKQIKAAAVYNNAFTSTYKGGDGKELCATDHPMMSGGTFSNELSPAADLSETALENMLIQIAGAVDDRNVPIYLMARTLHIPKELVFEAHRILKSPYRVGTSDNDVNAIYDMGMFPGGVHVNHRFTDADAWFVRTDCPNGMRHFLRKSIYTASDGDFETGNFLYKSRERYSFGWSDPRAVYGSTGAA